jgi:hypothetical protein
MLPGLLLLLLLLLCGNVWLCQQLPCCSLYWIHYKFQCTEAHTLHKR